MNSSNNLYPARLKYYFPSGTNLIPYNDSKLEITL